ncbi:hypothetical protein [Taurinivorans muris]
MKFPYAKQKPSQPCKVCTMWSLYRISDNSQIALRIVIEERMECS